MLMTVLILASQANFITLPAFGAGTASLSFGESTLRKDCPGSISINLNTGGEKVWAADVGMTVSGNATVDSLVLGSVLPMQACNDASVPDLMLCGARQPGTNAFTGTGVYGTINVTPSSTGTLSLSFDGTTTNVINDSILDVLGVSTGASYTVKDRFNVAVDGKGFCNPDTTPPIINVDPPNGKNNVPADSAIKLILSDDRVGVDTKSLSFTVNGNKIDTFSYTKTGGTYTPSAPFKLGELVTVTAKACDLESNCQDFSGSFRITPPLPPASCGDKKIDEGEECDEGGQTANCDRDCTFVECGDGVINDMAGEQCDDYNKDDGDGCNSICTLEAPVEDLLYCPVVQTIEVSTRPVAPETVTTTTGETVLVTEGEGDQAAAGLPVATFGEAGFAQSASTSNTEVALRESATPLSIAPATPEQKEIMDPCILKYGTEGASLDRDGDGLPDRTECYAGTDPTKPDTDGDTCFDGEEINRFYTNPMVIDCSISKYVEQDVLITDPKPNWILTSIAVSGSAPRESLTVGVTAFPAIQKTFSQVLTQYEQLLNVLSRDVDPANTVAVQQKIADTTDSITKLQAFIKDTQAFIDENPESYQDLSDQLKQTAAFLDGGAAAISDQIEQAQTLFETLKKYETKSAFLGEVKELQTVSVGNTTTAGFSLESKKKLDDGLYDLVATAGFADGGTKSSAPVRVQLSSATEIGTPIAQTLDGIPIGMEKIVTKNKRPVLSGKSVYGSMVFVTWESLVLESSIITDSAEGNFDVQSPRDLEDGKEHTITMYAVTETDGGFIRSKNATVNFMVEKVTVSNTRYYVYGVGLFLFLMTILYFVLAGKRRRKLH